MQWLLAKWLWTTVGNLKQFCFCFCFKATLLFGNCPLTARYFCFLCQAQKNRMHKINLEWRWGRERAGLVAAVSHCRVWSIYVCPLSSCLLQLFNQCRRLLSLQFSLLHCWFEGYHEWMVFLFVFLNMHVSDIQKSSRFLYVVSISYFISAKIFLVELLGVFKISSIKKN